VSTSRTPRAAVLGLTVGALVTGGLVLAPTASAASTSVVINEVYGGGGNANAPYRNDFIELKNVSGAPLSVKGWEIQYASAGGTSWAGTILGGTIAKDGSYLIQEAAGTTNTSAASLPGPNAFGDIAMSGTAGKVRLVDPTGTVVDLVAYGSGASPYEGNGPTPAPSNTTSVARTGADTDDNKTDFKPGAPTPKSEGVSPDPRVCETGTLKIGRVQGAGTASPCMFEQVTVAGTVVGDTQSGLKGFFLQDGGDGDDATSDGIFVYAPSAPATIAVGDKVTVTATVKEYDGLTELDFSKVTADGPGDVPTATALPLPSTSAQREALEGMLVAPPTGLTVTEVYNLNRYGEVQLAAGGRLLSPTEAADTGAPSATVAAENAARSIILDDASGTDFSAAKAAPPYLTVDDPVRVGDTAQLPPVVLSEGHGAYRLQPADGSTAGVSFDATNPRPTTPGAVGGDLRIADFNVLNYFVDFPDKFGDDARGAKNADELAQQQAKEVTAITALDADVITLHEIENSAVLTPNTPYRAVQTLLAAIKAKDGHDWQYVEAHEDSDVITNAIVYRTDKVTAVGAPMVYNGPEFGNARSPIAQTFHSGDETFSIIANHLKSKGSGCGAGDDDTSVGGAGSCNATRVKQATALVAFAETVKRTSGDDDVLLTGDFNSYRFEDPIDAVTAAGYTDMAPVLAPGQYSYVFDGGSGSLDHVFASPSVKTKLTGLSVWDINAVESFAYEYDSPYEGLYADYAYRASDHNPTVFGLTTEVPATATISDPTPLRGDTVTVTGGPFDAGTTVTVTLPSQGNEVLGTGIAGPNGTVTVQFTVPDLVHKGSYQVDLTAADGEKASTSFTLRPRGQDVADRAHDWNNGGR